eukprot:SAG25_NODE_286_length_10355_cov_16.654544_5_plen_149_part_00
MLIIGGGGQAGLSLGARLRLLGVPYVIVEANQRVGDSWRARYLGLLLHDPVWYDHLPYMPFPASWPVFTPRDKIADWLEMYSCVPRILSRYSSHLCSYIRASGMWGAEGVRLESGAEGIRVIEFSHHQYMMSFHGAKEAFAASWRRPT